MKANNLSISIPNNGCNKNCPYCISKMTGYSKTNSANFFYKLFKARKMAEICGITSVSITGKGEPTLNMMAIEEVTALFEDYPLELQTNGVSLDRESEDGSMNMINYLASMNVDTIAISIDDFDTLNSFQYKKRIKEILNYGMTVRLTVNLVPKIIDTYSVHNFISFCEDNGITQLSFREITTPTIYVDTEESRKAIDFITSINNNNLVNFLKELFDIIKSEGFLIRELPYGAKLYMIGNVMITYFDYCIQDKSNDEDVRSLIYHEDGHMSTSWNGSHVGRLF